MNDDEYMGCSCLIMIVLFFVFVVLPIVLLMVYAEDIFTAGVVGTHRAWEIVDSVWTK
jgi:hypothetical protein